LFYLKLLCSSPVRSAPCPLPGPVAFGNGEISVPTAPTTAGLVVQAHLRTIFCSPFSMSFLISRLWSKFFLYSSSSRFVGELHRPPCSRNFYLGLRPPLFSKRLVTSRSRFFLWKLGHPHDPETRSFASPGLLLPCWTNIRQQ